MVDRQFTVYEDLSMKIGVFTVATGLRSMKIDGKLKKKVRIFDEKVFQRLPNGPK